MMKLIFETDDLVIYRGFDRKTILDHIEDPKDKILCFFLNKPSEMSGVELPKTIYVAGYFFGNVSDEWIKAYVGSWNIDKTLPWQAIAAQKVGLLEIDKDIGKSKNNITK